MDYKDYTEPTCPADNSMWTARPAPHSGGKFDLSPVISQYDRLVSCGDFSDGIALLEVALNKALSIDDKGAALSLYSELMGAYRQSGSCEKGMAAVEKGLELLSAFPLSDTPAYGTILINAATALSSFGCHSRALELYREAMACYSHCLAPEDVRFGVLMNNMAGAYSAAGDKANAEKYWNAAIISLQNGGGSVDIAVSRINLAMLCPESSQRQLDLAMEELNSPTHLWDSYYAYTCRKCAEAFRELGRMQEAADLEERADIINENS